MSDQTQETMLGQEEKTIQVAVSPNNFQMIPKKAGEPVEVVIVAGIPEDIDFGPGVVATIWACQESILYFVKDADGPFEMVAEVAQVPKDVVARIEKIFAVRQAEQEEREKDE